MVKDKVAIVTGATRGIGYAIAHKLAENGAKVVLCSRDEGKSRAAADKIKADTGAETLGIKADVSGGDEIKAMVETCIATFGSIDIYVSNAGVTKDNLLLRMSEDDWRNVIDINMDSVFLGTKAVLKPMLKQKNGRIINITSVVGKMGNPGQANYAASKAGIIGFTKSVAREIAAKGITVNAVAPGFIETDMTDALPDDYLNNIINTIPQKRMGKPEEVAALVLFLASDQAAYITGQTINVDGGVYM